MAKILVICFLAVAVAHAAVPRQGLSSIIENYYHPENFAETEDANLKVPQIIQKYGYPFEDHYVTTDDGYVLNIHRIPYGKSGPSNNRPVVFVMHGLLCSSADWIIAGPGLGLGYVLADAGYDVWLGNARGNTYSRKHIKYDPDNDEKEFWNFSWHEIGVKDLPAMIDYALQQTGQSSLFHIGHSQGTTSYYVMTSERPEYNKKIRAHFSLAPIAYMDHLKSPGVQMMSRFEEPIENLLDLIGVYEFMPNGGFTSKVSARTCDGEIGAIVCSNILFALCGFDRDQMNNTLLPIIMGHTPAGSSTMQLLHYGQEVLSAKFRQYDLGTAGNQEAYGDKVPPNYALEEITSPVYLFYSRNDWMSAVEDVQRLAERLPNLQAMLLVANEKWNHLDYMWGIDANTLVYEKILSLMSGY